MSELSELEVRISAALTRLKTGLDGLGATPAQAAVDEDANLAKIEQLTVQLNEERAANGQLEERVKQLKERQDGRLTELEKDVEVRRTRSARLDRRLQRLREVNAELRGINGQLREAVSAGVAEPELVNKAMLSELEALRATQAADAAEMDAILQELTPIITQEVKNAAG